jgi:hypothetical protein
MDTPALVFTLKDLTGFIGIDPAGFLGVMLGNEAGKGLSYDETYIQWFAGVGACRSARAVDHDDVVRISQDDVAGIRIGDDLFEVPQVDILLDANELPGSVRPENLAVVDLCNLRVSPG